MKKIALYCLGTLAALSLAACTPTEPKEAKPQTQTLEAPAETAETKDGRAEKTPDPNVPELEMVSIYTANSDTTGLDLNLEGIEKLDAQSLTDLLIGSGALEEGTIAHSFDITGGEKAGPGVDSAETGSGERIGTLHLSKLPQGDESAEKMILAAIGNTFIDNFELDKLELLVNGVSVIRDSSIYITYITDYETFNK